MKDVIVQIFVKIFKIFMLTYGISCSIEIPLELIALQSQGGTDLKIGQFAFRPASPTYPSNEIFIYPDLSSQSGSIVSARLEVELSSTGTIYSAGKIILLDQTAISLTDPNQVTFQIFNESSANSYGAILASALVPRIGFSPSPGRILLETDELKTKIQTILDGAVNQGMVLSHDFNHLNSVTNVLSIKLYIEVDQSQISSSVNTSSSSSSSSSNVYSSSSSNVSSSSDASNIQDINEYLKDQHTGSSVDTQIQLENKTYNNDKVLVKGAVIIKVRQ